MEELVSALTATIVFFAIVYSLVKAVLAPIHEKLDRLLAMQEASTRAPEERV